MKKLILTTAICSLGLPAFAGPLLDSISPGSATITFSSENIGADVETYTDLKISGGVVDIVAKQASLVKRDGFIVLSAADAALEQPGGSVAAAEMILEFDTDLLTTNPVEIERSLGDNGLFTVSDCALIDLPMSASLKDVRVLEGGDDAMTADLLELSYDVIDPETACVLDASGAVAGLSGTLPGGVNFTLEELAFEGFTPLAIDSSPMGLSRDYASAFAMNNLVLSYFDIPQVRIGSIASKASSDPASLMDLMSSGYADMVSAFVTSELTGRAPDLDRRTIPAMWNALRAVESEAVLQVSDIEIVGDMAKSMLGTELLASGRVFDATIATAKNKQDIALNVDLSASDLLDLSLGIDFVMGEMDLSAAKMSGQAMLMSAPIGLGGLSFSLVDSGLGSILAQDFGMDVYTAAERGLNDMVGPQKASGVVGWLQDAREGGAYFSAYPASPIGATDIFTGLMGDWTDFGGRINAKTSK